jgi:hypothetical protein
MVNKNENEKQKKTLTWRKTKKEENRAKRYSRK